MTKTKGSTSQMASSRPGATVHNFGMRSQNITVAPANKVMPGIAKAKAIGPVQNKLPDLVTPGVATANKGMMKVPGGK